MKTINGLIIVMFLLNSLAEAQDTMYIYKSGAVVKQHAIANFDSLVVQLTPPETWTAYSTTNSGLAANQVQAIAIDLEGNKWFGTPAGVSELKDTTWINYTTNDGLVSNNVISIAIDKAGHKWFGTNSGVSEFDGTNFTTYNMPNLALGGNNINVIAVDRSNNKWFGTNNGVFKYNGSFTTFNLPPVQFGPNSSISANYILSIAIDSNDNKWLGGLVIYQFNDTNWTLHNEFINLNINGNNSGSLDDIIVYALTFDSSSKLWFGSSNDGISEFDGKNWAFYNTTNSGLDMNDIRSLGSDKLGNIWTGVYNELFKFDGQIWTKITPNIPFYIGTIYCITSDNQGNKWFGTDGFAGALKFGSSK